ncbi:hypothetical protein D3C85_1368480 [compost metagenome]
MSLVQNDPTQRLLLPGNSYDGLIYLTHHHVFEHGPVGNQNRCRLRAHQLTRQNFVGLLALLATHLGMQLWCIAIVKAIADAISKTLGPGIQALTLRVDEGVEWIQKQCPDTDQRVTAP